MAGPSTSELLGYRGDAALGAAGNGGVNITEVNTTGDLPYLNNAANMIADATKIEYNQYQKNLESALANLNSIKTDGILNNDYKVVTDEYAGFLKDVYDNYDVIRNPLKNVQKSSELKQREAKLRAMIEQSKAQKTVLDQTREFVTKNPKWNTAENQALIDNFEKSPVTSRELFNLKAPPVASIAALASTLVPLATVKFASSDLVDKGKYIKTETGEYVDLDKLRSLVPTAIRENGEYGNALGKEFDDMFSVLPPQQQSKYADSLDFVTQNVLAYATPKKITTSKLDENQLYMQKQQQNFTAGQNALDRDLARQKLELEKDIAGKNKIDLQAAGAYKNQLLTTAFTTGQVPPNELQDIYGDNKPIQVKTYPQIGYEKVLDPKTNKMVDDPTQPIYNRDAGETVQTLPTTQVTKTALDANGNLLVTVRNNATGKDETKTVTSKQANTDFNNILGKDKAMTIADGSRRFLKSKTGSENFDLNKAQQIFNLGNTPATNSPPKKVKIPGL